MKFLLSLCVALVLLTLVTAGPSPRPPTRNEVMKEVMKEGKQENTEVALYVTNTACS